MEIIDIPIVTVEKGDIVYNIGADMASADPIRYSRLVKAGKLKEAEEMWNEKGYEILLEDEELM